MTRLRQMLLVAALLLVILAMGEVALYNWRLTLALGMEDLESTRTALMREKEELENLRASLLSPTRLEQAGSALGLAPLPLSRLALVLPEPGEETVASLR
jgi:hypothetical protein